ncbi:MAG: hypothetical protein Q9221_002154 [Calogaya cf. arnoldii]
MEPWMANDEWNQMGCGGTKSEFDCVSKLGQAQANQAFATHWSTWTTKDDIAKMQSYGINTIRIPVGYWMREDLVFSDSEHFPQGSLKYLEQICGWASDAGFYIIIDLHGAPGAQVAGNPSTGQNASSPGFYVDWQYERAYKFLEWMTSIIQNKANTAYRNVGMLEIVNEPLQSINSQTDSMRKTYYPTAWKRIRTAEDALHNTKWYSGDPHQYLTDDWYAAFDDHRYLKYSNDIGNTPAAYLKQSCIDDRGGNWPTIVGEFSLSPADNLENSDPAFAPPGDHQSLGSSQFRLQTTTHNKTCTETGAMDCLMMLEPCDRERFLKRQLSGQFDEGQLGDENGDCFLATMTKRLQLHVPDLPSYDSDDPLGYLNILSKFEDATSNKDSEYNKILKRAENVRDLVDDIFDDWGKLRTTTRLHGEALARRWTKRTVPKRKKILLGAWPGINPLHRPDFEVIRHGLEGPSTRDALLLPYINSEDLSSEKNLLEFMNARAKVHPEYFAFSDSLRHKTAVTLKAIKPAAQYTKVMLLVGQQSRETYGKLRSISDAEVENIIWTGYAFQLAHGIVILETQQRLYRFLLRCAELLLHDTDLSQVLLDVDNTVQEGPSDLADVIVPEPAEWLSVSKLNTFSLDHLLKLAGAERDAAENLFWALHEDPGLFQGQVTSLVRQSLVPCRRAFDVGDTVEPAARLQAGIHIVLDVCHDIILWEAIDEDLKKLKILKDSISTDFQLSERLPPDYEEALESFIPLVFMAWKYGLKKILRVMVSSDKFVDFFEMVTDVHGTHTDFRLRKSSTTPPIINLLADLYETDRTLMMGALNILDEFERIFESDVVQRGLIDTDLNREISNLSALAQMQDALERHQPTIQVTVHDGEHLLKHQLDRLNVIDKLEGHLAGTSLGPYTKPTSAFSYPVGKKPTSEHVEQMRRAEAKLDLFWAQVDNCKLKPRTGKTLLQWLGNRVTARSIHRTQPWQPVVLEPTQSARVQTAFQPFPDSTPEDSDKLIKEPRKKQKTRGETYFATEPVAPSASYEKTTPEPPVFALPKRLYKTMTAFFRTSDQEIISRKVVWKDFLHAMYGLRFRIEKRHGSEWYFDPSRARNAPITIHEPHPSHEMTFEKLRFEARRMARSMTGVVKVLSLKSERDLLVMTRCLCSRSIYLMSRARSSE